MVRKYFFIVLGLCLAATWVIKGFAQQHQKLNIAQTKPVLTATIDFEENGQIFNLLKEGYAKLNTGKLLIEHNTLSKNDASEITKITEIIFKVPPSDELLFSRIVVTMPFLEGYVKDRLIKEFMTAMEDSEIPGDKPNGKLYLTDREGNKTSTWNILGWHIESFNFPTLDSKDNTQLIQYVTIRVEKFGREDEDDNNDNE
jgi:hypothetical protein